MSEANSSPTKGHIHAALMLQYAQDAAETETPWERWQSKASYEGAEWGLLFESPTWIPEVQYRRKPHTILINGTEVPKALTDEPAMGQVCWAVDLDPEDPSYGFSWHGGDNHRAWLRAGVVHATQEAAEAHSLALLSFTKQA